MCSVGIWTKHICADGQMKLELLRSWRTRCPANSSPSKPDPALATRRAAPFYRSIAVLATKNRRLISGNCCDKTWSCSLVVPWSRGLVVPWSCSLVVSWGKGAIKSSTTRLHLGSCSTDMTDPARRASQTVLAPDPYSKTRELGVCVRLRICGATPPSHGLERGATVRALPAGSTAGASRNSKHCSGLRLPRLELCAPKRRQKQEAREPKSQ
jgi:hypothetical protein